MKPTVGRIVHFYTDREIPFSNGVGKGPYAAIITQVFGDDEAAYCNLMVFAPLSVPFAETSVRNAEFETAPSRYWVWPPRD
jgi:hypothetical protein